MAERGAAATAGGWGKALSSGLTLLLGLLAVAQIARLLLYIIQYYPEYIHSDSAVAILLAQEILSSGSLFPSGWYPANGEVWFLNRHLLALPALAVFGAGEAAYLFMQVTFALLFFAAAWYAARPLLTSGLQTLCVLALLAIPFSGTYYEHVFGQVSYGPLLLTAFLMAGMIGRMLSAPRPGITQPLALAALSLATAIGSPLRFAVYFCLPALGAVILAWLLLRPRAPLWQVGMIGTVLLAALLGGFGLNALILTSAPAGLSTETVQIVSAHEIWDNLAKLAQALLNLFELKTLSLNVAGPYRVLSDLYAYGAVALILGLSAAYLAWRSIAPQRATAPQETYGTVALLYALLSALLIAGVLTLTDTPVAARYMLVQVISCAFLLACLFLRGGVHRWAPVLVCLGLFAVPAVFSTAPHRFEIANARKHGAFAAFLSEQGLSHGYSTDFWAAHVTTLVSGAAVTVRAITRNDQGLILPYRWLSRQAWYRQPEPDRFFVALPAGEALNRPVLAVLGLQHQETLRYEDTDVHVFTGHAALTAAPFWQDATGLTLSALTSATQIGQLERDETGPHLVSASPGYLTYGHRIALPPGDHTLKVTLECSPDAEAILDAYSLTLKLVHSFEDLCRMEDPKAVAFRLRQPVNDIEFRIFLRTGTAKFYSYAVDPLHKTNSAATPILTPEA